MNKVCTAMHGPPSSLSFTVTAGRPSVDHAEGHLRDTVVIDSTTKVAIAKN